MNKIETASTDGKDEATVHPLPAPLSLTPEQALHVAAGTIPASSPATTTMGLVSTTKPV
jgi:hypothetical protein